MIDPDAELRDMAEVIAANINGHLWEPGVCIPLAAQAARNASHAHKRLVEVEAGIEAETVYASTGMPAVSGYYGGYNDGLRAATRLVRQALSSTSGEVGGDGETTMGLGGL